MIPLKKVFKVLDYVPEAIKFVSLLVLFIVAALFVLSSATSTRFLSRKLVNSAKEITKAFKEQGMNEVEVESKLSLGLISLKVTAIDKKQKRR